MLELGASGPSGQKQGSRMGVYDLFSLSKHAVYKQREGGNYIYYKRPNWYVSRSLGKSSGGLRSRARVLPSSSSAGTVQRPPSHGWNYYETGEYRMDPTITLEPILEANLPGEKLTAGTIRQSKDTFLKHSLQPNTKRIKKCGAKVCKYLQL